MKKTTEELAAEAAAAEAQAKAETQAKEQADAAAAAEAAEAAAKLKEEQDAAIAAAVSADRERVGAIFAATPAGFEAVRDEAIKSGSSVAGFAALIEAAKKAAVALHAGSIGEDTAANAAVKPSTGANPATGDDAAVSAILGSFKLATGE